MKKTPLQRDQSYRASMSVNSNSRVTLTSKLPKFTTQDT